MSDLPVTRRQFLQALGAGALAFASPHAALRPSEPYFTWAQLRYPGVWDPNPRAHERILSEIRRRTSVEVSVRRAEVTVGDPALFDLPFLYVTGRGDFPDPGPEADGWLRRYVEHGGFVLFDDATGTEGSRFAAGVERWLARAFPGRAPEPLPSDHAVFQSFYLLNSVAGRQLVRPVLTGIGQEDLTPVVFCANDLGGAWDGDSLGGFSYPCVPGGERQREMSFRLGVNLVLYAMTGNYKKDQVHIPFILKRRQRR
jgi:hypothetical protein